MCFTWNKNKCLDGCRCCYCQKKKKKMSSQKSKPKVERRGSTLILCCQSIQDQADKTVVINVIAALGEGGRFWCYLTLMMLLMEAELQIEHPPKKCNKGTCTRGSRSSRHTLLYKFTQPGDAFSVRCHNRTAHKHSTRWVSAGDGFDLTGTGSGVP